MRPVRSVTPHLICAGATAAIDSEKKAFDAVELKRPSGPNGKLMHGSIRIGGSIVMVSAEFPEMGGLGPKSLKGSPITIHLYVEDVDVFAAPVVAAGAKVTTPVADMFLGDRYGKLEDPFGHRWSVATHVRDVKPEEMQHAMCPMGRQG
jgi:PhnB protein